MNIQCGLLLLFAAPVAACWLLRATGCSSWNFPWCISALCCLRTSGIFPAAPAITASFFWPWSPQSGRHERASRLPSGRRWLFGGNSSGQRLSVACMSLSSELRPFSESYETAAWIKQNNLADGFLIGSHDAQVSTVVGYLAPAGLLSRMRMFASLRHLERCQGPVRQAHGRGVRQSLGESGDIGRATRSYSDPQSAGDGGRPQLGVAAPYRDAAQIIYQCSTDEKLLDLSNERATLSLPQGMGRTAARVPAMDKTRKPALRTRRTHAPVSVALTVKSL